MPAFATDQDAALEREEVARRTRDAWVAYGASLRDLAGREYEEAEAHAWERLQRRLGELAR